MSSFELKNIDFGEIKNITLYTEWGLEPLMQLVYSELANDVSHWVDLYKNGDESRISRAINFPQSIDIKVEYDKYILNWQCFQTKEWLENQQQQELTYDTLVDLWESTPTHAVQVTPSQENWYKEIYGLKFVVCSLEHKRIK